MLSCSASPPAQEPLFQVAWSTRSPLRFAFLRCRRFRLTHILLLGWHWFNCVFSLPIGSVFFAGFVLIFLRIPHLHLGDRRGNFILGDSARACDTQIPLMELVVLARPICFLPRSSQNIVICTFIHHSHACTTFMCMCISFVRTHAHLCMCVHVCIMCACAFSKWRRTLATTAGSAGSTQGGC